MRQTAVLCGFLLLSLPAFSGNAKSSTPSASSSSEEDQPELRIDAPWRVEAGVPFHMVVTYYVPAKHDADVLPVTKVTTDNTGDVTYSPTDFTLAANERKDVTVIVKRTQSGLAELTLTDDCCDDPRLSVDTGFRGRFKWDAGAPLESQVSQWATIAVVDGADRPLPLDAPIKLNVRSSGALIRYSGQASWSSELTADLAPGSTGSPTIEIRPQPMSSTEGTLQVRAFLNDESLVLVDTPLRFKIIPPTWIRLGATILGALVYTLFQLSKTIKGHLGSALVRAVAAGIFAGIFGWALADWNLLGIKTDPEHLTGYFVLGILTAYAGVEPVLDRFAKRRAAHDAEKDGGDKTGETEA
jgi:hypothetical protein